jgi:shikimate dehydrogenase
MTDPGGSGAPGRVLTADQVGRHDGAPLILFVGISTAGSLAHRAFPAWAQLLGKHWTLLGVDLPADTTSSGYRELVTAVRDNPRVAGAVITSHKLQLAAACADLLDLRDPLADVTREVNCIAADGGRLRGYARDPVSLIPALDRLPGGRPRGHVLCLGAGGAATALLLALTVDVAAAAAVGPLSAHPHPPASLVFADVRPGALDALQKVAGRCPGAHPRPVCHHLAGPADAASLTAALPTGSLVINATGLGKDRPGSPLPLGTGFPERTVAWDLNYRGDLAFLEQARTAGARTAGGWDYFLAGWAGTLTAIARVPFTVGLLDAFTAAAESYRQPPPGREAH